MSNTFIELREQDAQNKFQSGFYKSVLNEKTKISSGDQILINKAFIDTQTINQQNINIPETLTLNLGVILYGTKIASDNAQTVPAGFESYDGKVINANKNYVACTEVVTASNPGMKFIQNLSYTYLSSSRADFVDYGEVDIKISYTDVDSQPAYIMVHIPMTVKDLKYGQSNDHIIDNINITYNSDPTFPQPAVSTSQKVLDKANVKITLGASTDTGDYHWTPFVQNGTYTLEKGSYTPQALCSVLNRQFQLNDTSKINDDNTIVNQFLIDSGYLRSQISFIETTENTDKTYPSGSPTLYNQTNGFHTWLGASSVELAYDVDNDKFFWNYLHTPFYDSNGGEALKYAEDSTNPTDYKRFVNNKVAGVCFNYMNAQTEEGNYVNFWGQQLGFNLNQLLTSWDLQVIQSTVTGAVQSLAPLMYTVDGYNTTGNFINGSSAINTKAPHFYVVPDYSTPIYSTSFNTFKIDAGEKSVNVSYEFPYFIVELKAGYLNNVYDINTNHRDIGAIVGKYYTLNSFTFGSVSDSVPYIHEGEDIYLSDFQIRILNPDKQIAPGVGDNNSIVLQIIKGTNN